jgi:hypothetical protein
MGSLQERWQEEINKLCEIELPDSLDWASQNVPHAREYLEKTYSEAIKSISFGRKGDFDIALEKYVKAWLRLWQLMAIDHFKNNDIMEIDMRYYRHLPDGYSMKWSSNILGKTFTVYPRKPKNPKDDELWITAGEMIKINENPVLFATIEKFDGWFDRDSEDRNKGTLEKAIEYEKRNKPPIKLKEHRRDKHGVQWFK